MKAREELLKVLQVYKFLPDPLGQERPYQDDSAASRPLSEAKHLRARLVLRWGTTLESLVLFFWHNEYQACCVAIVGNFVFFRTVQPYGWRSCVSLRIFVASVSFIFSTSLTKIGRTKRHDAFTVKKWDFFFTK